MVFVPSWALQYVRDCVCVSVCVSVSVSQSVSQSLSLSLSSVCLFLCLCVLCVRSPHLGRVWPFRRPTPRAIHDLTPTPEHWPHMFALAAGSPSPTHPPTLLYVPAAHDVLYPPTLRYAAVVLRCSFLRGLYREYVTVCV